MKKKLLLIADMTPDIWKKLEERYEVTRHPRWKENSIAEDDLAAILREAAPEVLVPEAQALTARVLERVPSLRLIASVRTTPANIDLDYCRKAGILVSTSPGRNALAVVEMTIAFILDCARSIPRAYYDIMRRDITLPVTSRPRENAVDVIWVHPDLKQAPYLRYRGMEISGKTLGLVGFGAIGKMIVAKAKAFDMRVLVYDPYVDAAAVAALGAEKGDLDWVLRNSDFVSLHAKVTRETTGLMNRERFAQMKRSAFLVNTARGGLVNQADLVQALRDKVIAGAALDVFENEPLFENDPLLELDNVILTPHIGGATADVVRHQSELVLANIAAYTDGAPLPHQAK